jgi:hypothetical protein
VMMKRMKNEGKESQCVKYKFGKYGCRAYHPDHAKIILTWSSTHSNSMESNLYLTLRRHVYPRGCFVNIWHVQVYVQLFLAVSVESDNDAGGNVRVSGYKPLKVTIW